MTPSQERILSYIRQTNGKHLDLTAFMLPDHAGVVLHDDIGALQKAAEALAGAGAGAYKITPTDPKKRFRGLMVDRFDGKRVVLFETGMGSMNASVVIHELAAGLDRYEADDKARRILKIGTCGGLCEDQHAGSILVPPLALDDEGASRWNEPSSPYSSGKGPAPLTFIPADGSLTVKWLNFLNSVPAFNRLKTAATTRERSGFDPLEWWRRHSEQPKRSIWTSDGFYGRRWHAKCFGHVVSYCRSESGVDLVGLENECSSHFSACEDLKLPIAAALVVSWPLEAILALSTSAADERSTEDKRLVHTIEEALIIEAVNYLFDEKET